MPCVMIAGMTPTTSLNGAKSLNDDFQKVYFATKSSGEIVELYEMTYAEMLNRMISLMYVVLNEICFNVHSPILP